MDLYREDIFPPADDRIPYTLTGLVERRRQRHGRTPYSYQLALRCPHGGGRRG